VHDVHTPVAEQRATWLRRTFESFSLPQYRLFWAAMMAQMGAMNMQLVARSWLVYELTNQYTMLGLVMLAGAVPMLLLSLWGGAMADRVQKKRVLQMGQTASAFVALGIAIAIMVDVISLERHTGVVFLLAASAVQGAVMGLMMPSRQAIIPELVGHARLMNAVALNSAGMNINRLLAPGVAGLLIAVVGVQTVYLTMTALYLVGVVLVTMLPPTGTMALGGKRAWGDVVDGLKYLRYNTTVMRLLLLTLFGVVLSMPYMFLMPAFAKDIQVVEPGQYTWLPQVPLVGGLLAGLPELLVKSSFRLGVLMSVSGVGSLASSLLVASMSNKNRGQVFLWGILFLGVALALYAFASSFILGLIFMLGVGLGQSIRMALSNTLVQHNVDDEYRGRIMSIYMMEFGLTSFSVFGVSLLANAIGIQWAVGGTALLLIPVALFYLIFVPTIRRLQ